MYIYIYIFIRERVCRWETLSLIIKLISYIWPKTNIKREKKMKYFTKMFVPLFCY